MGSAPFPAHTGNVRVNIGQAKTADGVAPNFPTGRKQQLIQKPVHIAKQRAHKTKAQPE